MTFLPVDMLRSGAHELGIELSDSQIEALDRFARFLVETNRSLNLTRITEPEEMVTGHYLDSLTCLAAVKIPEGAKVIDIGTGAGFPGIPIKIARPDLKMTLMDASLKKLKFIEQAVEMLGLERVELVHARSEDAAHDGTYREKYDVAFARALADMKVLAELCLPLVKVGGMLVAQKSEAADDEIAAARPVIGQLGGKVEKVTRVGIPGTEIVRQIVVARKTKVTPEGFPRAYSRIVKEKR